MIIIESKHLFEVDVEAVEVIIDFGTNIGQDGLVKSSGKLLSYLV